MAVGAPALKSSQTSPFASLNLAASAQYLGVSAAALYGLGFIVVNAYLSQFAATNRKLFDVEYIPAGILFVVLVGLYFAFMKLFLFEGEAIVTNVLKSGGATQLDRFWNIASGLFYFSGALFWLIFLALFISVSFFDEHVTAVFGQIATLMALSNAMFLQGLFDKHPRFRLWWFFAMQTGGIAIFSLERKNVPASTMSLFWALLVITWASLFFIGIEQKVNRKIGPHIITLLVILAGLAMAFGRHMYEKVPMALGGGKPVAVRLLVAPEAVPTVQQVLKLNVQLSDEVLLVTENQDEILVLAKREDGSQQPLRLSRRLFNGVIPVSSAGNPRS